MDTPKDLKSLIRADQKRMRGQERKLLPQALRPEGRLGVHIAIITDANLATATGFYQLTSSAAALNSPQPGASVEIEAVQLSSESVFQTARVHGTNGMAYAATYTRDYRASAGWGPWRLRSKPLTNWTPVIYQGATLGNGSTVGEYEVSDGVCSGRLEFILGSTSAITSDLIFEMPVPCDPGMIGARFGPGGRLFDASASTYYDAVIILTVNRVYVRTLAVTLASSGSAHPRQVALSSTTPHTWATSDRVQATFSYPIA